MDNQMIAIRVLELWLLLPAVGVPFGVYQYKKGCPDFIVNLVVWVLLIPFVFIVSSLGFLAFTLLLVLAALLGCLELASLAAGKEQRGVNISVGLGCSLPPLAVAYTTAPELPWPFLLFALLLPLGAMLLPRYRDRGIPMWTLALSFGAGLAFWLGIHSAQSGNGSNYVLWGFSVVAVNDILAAVVGKLVRSPKPFPYLSPNKSVAGYLGGMVCALAAAFLLSFTLPSASSLQIFTAAILLTCAGGCGDLFASWIKRRNNVKDFGSRLLTMGGVLDRLDSLLAAGPVFYLYMQFVGLA